MSGHCCITLYQEPHHCQWSIVDWELPCSHLAYEVHENFTEAHEKIGVSTKSATPLHLHRNCQSHLLVLKSHNRPSSIEHVEEPQRREAEARGQVLDWGDYENLVLQDSQGDRQGCIVWESNEFTAPVRVNRAVPIPVGIQRCLGDEMNISAPDLACNRLGFCLVEVVLLLSSIPCCALAVVYSNHSRVFVHVPDLQQAGKQGLFIPFPHQTFIIIVIRLVHLESETKM
nr:hypothetical protein CR513_28647 [Ipomoea batatas]